MKASSLSEIQKELIAQPPKRLVELCVRLAKHKKENKELLTYLLFEAGDEATFISGVKAETESQFAEMNKSNLYLAKKSLRKILRMLNKHIKFSGSKQSETELRIHYCRCFIDSGIKFGKSQVLLNLYENQLKKIEAVLSTLHDDLQFDYRPEYDALFQ